MISRGKRQYPAKDIVESYYPEIWNQSTKTANELKEIQEKLVLMFPACKKNLPRSFEELTEQKAQCNLSDFIRLRLLYGFVEELWKSIDKQCRDLANKHNEHDIDGEIDSEAALRQMLEAISSFPLEEVENDGIAGIIKFNENYIQKEFKRWIGNTRFDSWRCDIIMGISENGIQCEWLWRDAVGYTIPTDSNLGELLSDI